MAWNSKNKREKLRRSREKEGWGKCFGGLTSIFGYSLLGFFCKLQLPIRCILQCWLVEIGPCLNFEYIGLHPLRERSLCMVCPDRGFGALSQNLDTWQPLMASATFPCENRVGGDLEASGRGWLSWRSCMFSFFRKKDKRLLMSANMNPPRI